MLHIQEKLLTHKHRLDALIYDDPRLSIRELATMMDCDHSTTLQGLYSIGKVEILGVRMPLGENNKNLLAHYRLACQLH